MSSYTYIPNLGDEALQKLVASCLQKHNLNYDTAQIPLNDDAVDLVVREQVDIDGNPSFGYPAALVNYFDHSRTHPSRFHLISLYPDWTWDVFNAVLKRSTNFNENSVVTAVVTTRGDKRIPEWVRRYGILEWVGSPYHSTKPPILNIALNLPFRDYVMMSKANMLEIEADTDDGQEKEITSPTGRPTPFSLHAIWESCLQQWPLRLLRHGPNRAASGQSKPSPRFVESNAATTAESTRGYQPADGNLPEFDGPDLRTGATQNPW